ncbi:hypothetical protein WJX74_005710 [Apatococcus lobatus]|uniref:Uncharacterized protein n=2 Tax=Apatococcus lobatus TaxID=904363 RepID=A0AAW1RC61_9CHLO
MELFKNFQSEDLKDQHIRATPECPRRVSVFDSIKVITGNENHWETWAYLSKRYPEVLEFVSDFKFPGKGQRNTPVVGSRGLVTIMNLLQGERAARFRAAEADVLVRYLGGDLSLVREVQGIRQAQEQLPEDHPARMFGEHVEAEGRLENMLETGQKLVALNPDLKETVTLLGAVDVEKYGVYLELRCKEIGIKREEVGIMREGVTIKREDVELDERQLGVKEKRFQLVQREDEHGVRMEKERGDITDRNAKRRRYDARTDEGITITAILAKMGESARDARAFIRQAEDVGVRLRAYQEFSDDLIPGTRSPRQYRQGAAGAIAAAIAKWVAAVRPEPEDGIKKYFGPAQAPVPAPAAGGGDVDLYA